MSDDTYSVIGLKTGYCYMTGLTLREAQEYVDFMDCTDIYRICPDSEVYYD